MWLVVELTQLKGSSGSVPAANAWTVRKSGFRWQEIQRSSMGAVPAAHQLTRKVPFLQLVTAVLAVTFLTNMRRYDQVRN